MWNWLKKYKTLLIVVLVLALWSGIFYFIPADTVVDYVGVGNSYAVAFGISLIAGFSLFTGTTAYAAVIEFARGGSDPLWLGLASGVGLFLSDTGFYLLITKGRGEVESRFKKWFKRIHALIVRVPSVAVYIGTYFFCAFGPIPNDLIMVALVVSGYDYKKIWPFMLAGDVTFMLFLSYIFQA